MPISLQTFEQQIDETILLRGYSYFKNGKVKMVEEISSGCYQATVAGLELYEVELQIEKGNIVAHHCDCPFDMGDVCKHIVAVIFYLQKEELNLQTKAVSKKSNTKNPSAKKVKRKTVEEQINELLEKISTTELKQFIREKATIDEHFRLLLLSTFANKSGNESKEIYAKQINAILYEAGDGGNFIEWSATEMVGKVVSELLQLAQKYVANDNYESAVYIGFAVLEQLIPALQNADDSNGNLGGCIDGACILMDEIVVKKMSNNVRLNLLQNCFHNFEKQVFVGWEWHLGLMKWAAQIFSTDEEAQKILANIDSLKGSEFEHETAQTIKWQVLKKLKGDEAAEKFLLENIANPAFRREAILQAMQNNNFEKAISFANDGIAQHEKEKSGLVNEWINWLLKIALAQNDLPKIVQHARYLFVDNFSHEQNYFNLLKNNVAAKKWNDFLETIITEIETRNRWTDVHLLATIFIAEQWWDRLLKLVRQNVQFQIIEQYEMHLAKDYANELAQLYEVCIIKYLEQNVSRSHYQTACKYLRRMKKMGANERVKILVQNFKNQYPQRKALMEELDKV